MLTNTMSLEDHVKKINLAKSKVKNSIFEMAEAITNAVNQLDNQQKDLAQKLGMSRGTLSKWIAIGSNQSLMNMKNSVPESFDTLYQLSGSDCMTFWDVRSDLAFTFDMAAITNESGFATEAKYSDNDSPRASLRVSLVV